MRPRLWNVNGKAVVTWGFNVPGVGDPDGGSLGGSIVFRI